MLQVREENAPAIPALAPGDCAVIGFSDDSSMSDFFAIVLLADLAPGETLFVTDDGWDSRTNKFLTQTSETDPGDRTGYPSYTYDQHFELLTGTKASGAQRGTVLTGAHFIDTSSYGSPKLQYGEDGVEQLFIYRGTKDNPTFLCGATTYGRAVSGGCTPSPTTATSDDFTCSSKDGYQHFTSTPPGAFTLQSFDVSDEKNKMAYDPSKVDSGSATTGTKSELQAKIYDTAHWQ